MNETPDAARRRDERLRRLLRDADPLGSGAADEETSLLRIGARLTSVPRKPRRSVWAPVAAFALLLAIALLSPLVRDRRPVGVAARATVHGSSEPTTGVGRQQLQFETPGGTRLIWVLDPGFSLSDEP